MTEKERMHFSASVAGIDFEAAELRITALLIAQRDRFEQAWAAEANDTVSNIESLRDPSNEFEYQWDYTFLRGAWHGWKLRERFTGLDPFMGFILEAANEGELAAHDDACLGMMGAIERLLDGKDDGSGVSSQPWEGIRRRLLALKQGEDCWRWVYSDGTKGKYAHMGDGPTEAAFNAAQFSSFAPVTVEKLKLVPR